MLEIIKNFLKKFFNTSKVKLIESATNVEFHKKELNNFKDDIKLENNEEYRISDLQNKFKNGKIKVEEMKEEEKDALIALYIQDIKEQLKRLNGAS